MEIELLGQPFIEDRRLGRLLEETLPAVQSFWVLSAWAQLSGLRALQSYLQELRERDAFAEAIVGIDGGIATRESLELAIDLFKIVHVFHDPRGRIYHPKLYCAEMSNERLVIVGSSNQTEGGLYTNYEANVAIRLRRGETADDQFYNEICAFRDLLKSPGMPCQQLDRELLEWLAQDKSLVSVEAERRQAEVARREKAKSLATQIFGFPNIQLPGKSRVTNARRSNDITRPTAQTITEHSVRRWWKKLKKSDVVRKEETSHQRNYVILNRGRNDIDQKTWFREQFFAHVSWHTEVMRTGNLKEVAVVPFEVFIDSVSQGLYELQIEHAEHRIAGQNNSPTWLHWLSLLEVIRRQDFVGWYLILEQFSRSRYILQLTRSQLT